MPWALGQLLLFTVVPEVGICLGQLGHDALEPLLARRRLSILGEVLLGVAVPDA